MKTLENVMIPAEWVWTSKSILELRVSRTVVGVVWKHENSNFSAGESEPSRRHGFKSLALAKGYVLGLLKAEVDDRL